jgi:LmbE family N-acetylglucosaminyl deacetylase
VIDAGRYERSLFVGAHLDDIELAAGGTSAVLAKEGCQVHWLVLSNSSYESYNGSHRRDKDVALREGNDAAGGLGISRLEVREYPSKDIENNSLVVETIEEVIESFDPTMIFTHWPFDTHKAHLNSSLTTIAAARRRNSILMYEPIYPSGRSYVPFRPQLYFVIDDFIDLKATALRKHRSEYAKFGDEWIEGVVARARFRGYEVGAKYAEVFEVLRLEA